MLLVAPVLSRVEALLSCSRSVVHIFGEKKRRVFSPNWNPFPSDYKTTGSHADGIQSNNTTSTDNSPEATITNTLKMYAATLLVSAILIISAVQGESPDTRQKTGVEIDRTYHGNDRHGDSKWHTDSVRATHDFWTSKDGNVQAGVYAGRDRHDYGQYGAKTSNSYGFQVRGTFPGKR